MLARNHGLAVLKDILEKNSNFEFIGIFTHKFNPKIYDPNQNIRNDFQDFYSLSKEHNIDIFTIDKKDEKFQLEKFSNENEFDFLISISWRYLISPQIFKKAKIASFNIHRGDLPKYAGVEPIKQALLNHEKQIGVTSHNISEEIDQGKIISKKFHPVHFDNNKSLEDNIERLKKEITPYFVELNMESLNSFLRKNYE